MKSQELFVRAIRASIDQNGPLLAYTYKEQNVEFPRIFLVVRPEDFLRWAQVEQGIILVEELRRWLDNTSAENKGGDDATKPIPSTDESAKSSDSVTIWEVLSHESQGDWDEMREPQYRAFISRTNPRLWLENGIVKRAPAGVGTELSLKRWEMLLFYAQSPGEPIHPHKKKPSPTARSSIQCYRRLRVQIDPHGEYLKTPPNGLHEGWGFIPGRKQYCIAVVLP